MSRITTLVAFSLLLFAFSAKSQTAEDLYNEALKQLDEGVRASDVLMTLERCIQADNSFEEAHYLRAFIYYKMDEFGDAIQEYDRILEISPYNELALKYRALAKLQIYDYEGAIEDHNTRLDLRPDNAVAYFDRAYCRGLLHDTQGSINDYSKAIELNPDYKEAYSNRALAMLNLMNDETAIATHKYLISDVCDDLMQASDLGDSTASVRFGEYCR